MNATFNAGSSRLGRASSAFVLAAGVAILFNTALAWAKDAYAPLNKFMGSVTGHHWTTHGLADVILFLGLGLILFRAKVGEKIRPDRLISFLIWSVAVASIGLVAWFALF